MPLIVETPVRQGDQYVTTYENNASLGAVEYTFSELQQTLTIFNFGLRNIVVIANGQRKIVEPNDSESYKNVNAVSLEALQGSQRFRLEGRKPIETIIAGTVDSVARETLATKLDKATYELEKGETLSDITGIMEDVNGRGLNFKRFYDGQSSSLKSAVEDAINETSHTVYFPNGTFDVSEFISMVDKNVSFQGDNTEFKTVTNGLDKVIVINDRSNFKIKGFKFNNNLKGRTILELNRCTNFVIEDNEFTGYSAEYGYYQTDSAIKMTNCQKGFIYGNRFINLGDQYGTDSSTLNRAITINDNATDDIIVKGNLFKNVNQGIVSNGGQNSLVIGNIFDNVKDNCLYILTGVKGMTITGNTFRNKNDEAIVFSGENISIVGNRILDSPNKAFAVTGNAKNILIADNIIDNTNTTAGQLFIYRALTHSIDTLKIEGNIFRNISNSGSAGAYEYFLFGNVTNLSFRNNTIQVPTVDYQRILYFNGTTTTGYIQNNYIEGSTSATVAIEVNPVTDSLYFDSNELKSCRGVFKNLIVRNQLTRTDIGPYIQSVPKVTIVHNDVMPTRGTWKKGDIVWNNGTSINVLCWRRATDGSNHVLGTDWIEFKSL